MVAEQVRLVQNVLGYPTMLYDDVKEEQVWFHVKKLCNKNGGRV
jgi:hypothetical protein